MSLLVHTILAAAVFFSYKQFVSSSEEHEHPCACCTTTINLNQVKHTVTKKTEKKPVKAQKKEQLEKMEKKPKRKPKPKVKKKVKRLEEAKPVQEPKEKIEQVEKTVPKEVVQNKTAESIVPHEELNTTKDTHCKSEVLAPEKTKNKQENYLSLHVNEIVALLQENLYYPRSARRRGIEGVVKVKFTLSKDAKISAIEVLESSHDILSRAATQTIENLEGKMPKPDEELTLTIPINYNLK
ncbi:MAG: energy transducer TonB [Sulfurimonas sp.]